MRINFVLFNFLLLIFLGTLIYLYFYINYSTFEGFIDTTVSDKTGQLAFEELPATLTIRNGSKPDLYLLSAQHILYINEVFITKTPTLGNGYYWINLPVVGPKLIYCIADKNFFGGGWMLAMRSIFMSRTFGYTSKHWTYNSTLNASSPEIIQKLPTLLGTPIVNTNGSIMDPIQNFDISEINNRYNTENKYKYSSVGKNLYLNFLSESRIYIPTETDINNFDCKLDTYNYFRATEIMIVFYFKNEKDYKGGDGENDVGWVWTEKIKNPDAKISIQPTLLELFQYLDANNETRSNSDTPRTLTKFKKQGSGTKSHIWYSTKPDGEKKAFSFYGFNYKKNNIGVRIGFSFGSKDEITAINGVGFLLPKERYNFSGGRFIGNIKLKDEESAEILYERNMPISYEIYVK
jgi:hypothetical protein